MHCKNGRIDSPVCLCGPSQAESPSSNPASNFDTHPRSIFSTDTSIRSKVPCSVDCTNYELSLDKYLVVGSLVPVSGVSKEEGS